MPYRIINRIFPHNPDYILPVDNTWNVITSSSRGIDMVRGMSDNVRRAWTLKWSILKPEEMRAIRNFYHAMKGGYEAFLFCPFIGIGSTGNIDLDNYSSISGVAQSGGSGTSIPLENVPDIDDYFNNWIIEINGVQKIVANYDGFTKKITSGDFGSDQAGKTYKLYHLIGTGTVGGATNFNLTRKYDNYSEIKKYIYDESQWVSGGTLTSSTYIPKLWTHNGSTITLWTYDDDLGGANTFKFTNVYKYASNIIKYFEAPLICNVAPTNGHSIVASWYHCYLVRFAPDMEASEELFNFNLYNLREIKLVQVLEA